MMTRKKRKITSLALVLLILATTTLFANPGSIKVASASTPTLAFNDLDGYEWVANAVYALKTAGVIQGDSSGNFYPGNNINRAQFTVLLCRAFDLPVDLYIYAPSSFTDVSSTVYSGFTPNIEAAKDYVYSSGTTFNPGQKLNKEQLAYTLVKILNLDTSNASIMSTAISYAQNKYYKDWVNVDDTFKPYVALASWLGFLTGDGNGDFNPTTDLNRAEMAVFLYRAIVLGGGFGGGLFTDVKPGDWYYTAVMNLANRGVIHGYEDGTFKPDATVQNSDLPMWIAKTIYADTSATGYDPMLDPNVTSKLPPGFVPDGNSLTRAEAAYAVAKTVYLPDPSDVDTTSILSAFTDKDTIDAVYRPKVAAVVDAVYMKGVYDSSSNLIFNPTGSVTRAELATLLVHALPSNVLYQVFSDVPPSNWYYSGVMNLYYRSIVIGYEDGTFKPDQQLGDQLAEWVAYKVLHKSWSPGYDPTADPDVLAYFPNNTYAATREATAYVVLKVLNLDTTQTNTDDILANANFNDIDQINSACRTAMAYFISIGAIIGDQNGNLNPQGSVTRGDFCVFLTRVLNGLDISKMQDYANAIDAVKSGS